MSPSIHSSIHLCLPHCRGRGRRSLHTTDFCHRVMEPNLDDERWRWPCRGCSAGHTYLCWLRWYGRTDYLDVANAVRGLAHCRLTTVSRMSTARARVLSPKLPESGPCRLQTAHTVHIVNDVLGNGASKGLGSDFAVICECVR